MNRKTALGIVLALACLIPLTGCRYGTNRVNDFADIFQIGAGVTSENPGSGVLPPSLGLYVQATDFINLGALYFNGASAEVDGRGLFAGREERVRFGLGPWQRLMIDQDYENGSENYFKKEQGAWTKRLNSRAMRWWGKPAKELEYEFWSDHHHEGYPVMHRGWQHWANWNVELGLSEPFLTHLGFNFRAGFDPSEISDFLLGFLAIDFKRDDLTEDELREAREGKIGVMEQATPPAEQPAAVPAGTPDHGDPVPAFDPNADLLVIYFDYDQSSIRADQAERVAHNIQYLKDHPEVVVLLEGHCDERGTVEYNYALGERRAQTVQQALLEAGIAPERVRLVSKGEETPAVEGHDESAWAQNRRVVTLSQQ